MMTLLTALLLVLALPPGVARSDEEDKGPDVVMLDQVPGCFGAVKFDHRLHVGMSTMASSCSTCHHEAQEGTKIQTCRSCHEVTGTAVTTDVPGLKGAYHRQCLSCHKDWAHQNACGFCHTNSSNNAASAPTTSRLHLSMLQPRAQAKTTYAYQTGHKVLPVVTFHHEDHTKVFGLSCVECHGGDECGRCHGPNVNVAERPMVNRQETCYRCHAETRCVTCHDLGEKPRFDHTNCAGWKLRPAHAGLACTACHDAGKMPSRPRSEACTACHGAETNGFDHGQTGVALYGDHALYACVDCHSGRSEVGASASCTGCHVDRPIRGERRVGRGRNLLLNSPSEPPAAPEPARP